MKTQVKRKDEYSLRVVKAFIEDEGKGLARVDEDVMKSLGAVPGDAIMITGRRSTVARVAQTTAHYSGQNLIQVDGITRDNAQVSVDEWCTIQKVPFKQADTLILTVTSFNFLQESTWSSGTNSRSRSSDPRRSSSSWKERAREAPSG